LKHVLRRQASQPILAANEEQFQGMTHLTLRLPDFSRLNNMNKQITRVWTFESDSNPNIEYATLQYTDGSTSCNCKGWTRRLAAG
jgi:hypothetical protein